MPAIGPRCHELRIHDENSTWRIFYRLDPDAIILLAVLEKKTQTTPAHILDLCKKRLKRYENESN